MKIERIINGEKVEIELTDAEIFEAEKIAKFKYEREDLLSRFEVDDESKIVEIIEDFEGILGNDDDYFVSYWDNMNNIADKYGLEEREDY